MRVKVFGSAAGGGFPQWNCGCSNCRRLRLGAPQFKARSQAQIAVSVEEAHWFLLGASPDLRYQINAHPELQPAGAERNSPISGIVLLCADLDHVLGLLLLREWQRFSLYSTATVRKVLMEQNSMFRILDRMPDQIFWTDMTAATAYPLTTPAGLNSAIEVRLLSLSGHLPAYADEAQDLISGEAVAALMVRSPSGKRMVYVPGLPAITDALLSELSGCEAILVDGTFWTDDELIRVEGFGRTARAMGHLPMGGEDGSLAAFSHLSVPRKIFIHINNTNPVLDEESAEHQLVRESGWEIAYDGMELNL